MSPKLDFKIDKLILDSIKSFDRQIWDKLPQGVCVCEPEGRIVYFNKSAAKIWGREPTLRDPEHRYCGAFKMYETDFTPMTHKTCPMVKVLSSGKLEHEFEMIVEQPGGHRINILTHVAPLYNEDGALVGALNIFHDISEKRQLENKLAQAHKIASVGKRASKVGHDLNNLLTAILGSTEFGLQDLEPDHIAYPHFEQIKLITEKAIESVSKLVSRQKKNNKQVAFSESIGGETILVVDDEDSVRNVAIKLLNSLGYKTLAAGTAEEAFTLFYENHESIDLVLTDVFMPVKNGVEMVVEMKREKSELPVIFITGYGIDFKSKELEKIPEPFTSIQKPYTIEGLVQPIQDLLALKD